MLGVLESHPRPGRAGIGRLVDAVAVADAALVVVLARREPDDVRVLRVDDHRAERIRAVGLEDRRPGVAAVLGLPQVAGADRDVPHVGVLRIDRDVGYPARRQARPNRPELEVLERFRREAIAPALPEGRRRHRHNAHPCPDPCHRSLPEQKTRTAGACPSVDSSERRYDAGRRPLHSPRLWPYRWWPCAGSFWRAA